uniref:polo kinase n=1 Tax=Clastoptera arizonana TaxID=38151 RepID=A0A1B6CVI3_9HEMI
MSNRQKEEEKQIPDVIANKETGVVYMKGRFFGKGGFAKCYEIIDSKTSLSFALKIVSKKLLTKSNQKEKMVQEISIHKSLSHQHIVGFHGFFDDEDFVYVILELCRKRSMMELHRRRKTLTEPETRYFMKQILEGVLYIHKQGIIHRDLKLGNLFLNDNLEVKIGDFGLAAKIEYNGQRKKTLCGTPNYIAPEILNKNGHSYEVDVWSIGCIMYTLLVGKPPFETNSLKETYSRIKKCEYKLPFQMNKPAQTMIKAMLQAEPENRPNVEKLLDHEFFSSGYLPAQLPVSCLTMAPRFDALVNKLNTRKPLLEVNAVGQSPVLAAKAKPRQSVFQAGSEKPPDSTNTSECMKHLQILHEQLGQLLKNKNVVPDKKLNLEELCDPAAQPFVWISKWVDYSDKYGFGYQLCDDGVGVMFNDNTRLVLLNNQVNVHYIERNGSEYYYTMDTTPPELEKKMKLLSYFRRYMSDHLMKAGESHAALDVDKLSRIPYLLQWKRSTSSVIMHLTNSTVQINFLDHTKIILCPLMGAVTYIDVNKSFNTYRFSTLEKNGRLSALNSCLEYAYRKIPSLMDYKK